MTSSSALVTKMTMTVLMKDLTALMRTASVIKLTQMMSMQAIVHPNLCQSIKFKERKCMKSTLAARSAILQCGVLCALVAGSRLAVTKRSLTLQGIQVVLGQKDKNQVQRQPLVESAIRYSI